MSERLRQGILQDGVTKYVNAYAADVPDGRSTAEAFQRDADAFFQEIEAFDEHAAAVKRDARLSDLGRQERMEPIREAFRERLEQRAEAFSRRLQDVEKRYAYAPPKLDPDPAIAEARLANARSDARMMLDAAGERVADVMRQLVEANTDPAVTHLLMHTTWPTLYLQSRNMHANLWTSQREQLMPSVLPEAEAKKHRAAQAVTHLKKAAEIVKQTAHFALADRGFR